MVFVWLFFLLFVLAASGTAAWAGWRAAPFLPTRQRDVERVLRLARVKPGERLYDLGAGDGRFIVAAAKHYGAAAIGYEISLLPYLAARWRLAVSGLGPKARIEWKDFFHVDLSQADVIVCFLTPAALAKLGPKFKQELRPGTRIVSYTFSLPGWTPVRKDKPTAQMMSVYLYQV